MIFGLFSCRILVFRKFLHSHFCRICSDIFNINQKCFHFRLFFMSDIRFSKVYTCSLLSDMWWYFNFFSFKISLFLCDILQKSGGDIIAKMAKMRISTRILFWRVEFFLRIFYACYAIFYAYHVFFQIIFFSLGGIFNLISN